MICPRSNACNTGCMIGNTLFNHIMYADNLVILNPCCAGLQQLLHMCTAYCVEHDIKCNFSKSGVLICRTKEDKSVKAHDFKLSDNSPSVCDKGKYIGNFITEQMNNDDYIYRQCRM